MTNDGYEVDENDENGDPDNDDNVAYGDEYRDVDYRPDDLEDENDPDAPAEDEDDNLNEDMAEFHAQHLLDQARLECIK